MVLPKLLSDTEVLFKDLAEQKRTKLLDSVSNTKPARTKKKGVSYKLANPW